MNSVINYIRNNPGKCLFFLLFIIGVLTVGNYGISWDEDIQRETGLINYNYIFHGDSTLFSWKDRDYGVAFELPLIIAEKIMGSTSYNEIFVLRHLITHTFFLISGLFLYRLIVRLFNKKWMGIIGFLMLVSHPVVYSHSFFNSKDIPFLSMFIITLYLLVIALQRKKTIDFIWLGIGTGLLIDIRLMGVIIPAAVGAYMLVTALLDKKYVFWMKRLLLFSGVLVVTIVACWPFLWQSPVDNFILAFKNMSQFRWDDTVLFNGESVLATKVPWYYAPTWFGISTPLVFVLLGGIGLVLALVAFIRKPLNVLRNEKQRLILLMLVFFIGPLFMVILLNSVLYDAWRQLFFIYPAFIVASVYAIGRLEGKLRLLSVFFTYITIIYLVSFQIKQFPLQYVYFNSLVLHSKDNPLREKWETDYWCLSYSAALKYINKVDRSPDKKVAFSHYPGKYAFDFLDVKARKNFKLVTQLAEADYFVVVYRWHSNEYENERLKLVKSFTLGDSAFGKIFRVE